MKEGRGKEDGKGLMFMKDLLGDLFWKFEMVVRGVDCARA